MGYHRHMSPGLAGLISILFVVLQGISAAHAIQHGDAPHLHDGKECAIAAIQDRDEDAVSGDLQSIAAPVGTPEKAADQPSQQILDASICLPPSRAPPQNR